MAINASVLTINHVQILATPGDPQGLTYMMQDLGRVGDDLFRQHVKKKKDVKVGQMKSIRPGKESSRMSVVIII